MCLSLWKIKKAGPLTKLKKGMQHPIEAHSGKLPVRAHGFDRPLRLSALQLAMPNPRWAVQSGSAVGISCGFEVSDEPASFVHSHLGNLFDDAD
jgi:hypothetical protein